jgi:cation/acetate symporter
VIHATSPIAIAFFLVFVAITLGLSFYLGSRAKSTQGYFTAHGQIPWFVNGVAFAGDYLSAASFLGICGMIAFYGYDGFLYSIGYLAGWIVALFVVAEPMKRLGKFTFADALNSKFQSRGIQLAAGVSTLAVSVFYLIPQMVGAGVLVQPLLGLPHWAGVVLVGATVIVIVVTAGMVSTTWVQFLKGALLVIFSTVLSVLVLDRGFKVPNNDTPLGALRVIGPVDLKGGESVESLGLGNLLPSTGPWRELRFIRTKTESGEIVVWDVETLKDGRSILLEAQTVTKRPDKTVLINGLPQGESPGELVLRPVGHVSHLPGGETRTGPLGPLEFFSTLQNSEVILSGTQKIVEDDGTQTTIFYQKPTPGSKILLPGASPTFAGIRSGKFTDKLNFLSLMLALFCGTASLPHILIRYYTVKDEAAARKSTIVGIACIGFFYVLTLYMGLGAMTSGALDVTDSNMAAPLLARSISEPLFAVISAIAFTTVLGTVSGLILASAGAVSHDLISLFTQEKLTEHQQVRIAKISSVIVGIIAIYLGIKFKELNVSYLVGWAFSVAASANLPALVMMLFWRGTTRQGIIAAVLVGMISSLAWILLSGDTYAAVYGLPPDRAWVPFSQPGIVTIPVGFLTLVLVSLATRKNSENRFA